MKPPVFTILGSEKSHQRRGLPGNAQERKGRIRTAVRANLADLAKVRGRVSGDVDAVRLARERRDELDRRTP